MNLDHTYLQPQTPRDLSDALFALDWALTGALCRLLGDDVQLLGAATIWAESVTGEWA